LQEEAKKVFQAHLDKLDTGTSLGAKTGQ